jgi:hypothetical protein
MAGVWEEPAARTNTISDCWIELDAFQYEQIALEGRTRRLEVHEALLNLGSRAEPQTSTGAEHSA